MRTLVALATVVLLFGGCTWNKATYKRLSTASDNYNRVWQASLDVAERHYKLDQVNQSRGKIVSRLRVDSSSFDLTDLPGSIARVPRSLTTHRSRLTIEIRESDGTHDVFVKVAREREDTEAYADYSRERDSYDFTDSVDQTRPPPPQRELKPIWTPVGSDQEMEQTIIREIREELLK